MAEKRWTIYVCDCGYLSMTPGKCRSHPYPCRAMGPELTRVEVGPVESALTDDDRERLRGIAGEIEHLPAEFRRHFDQDGRDARFLRILADRDGGA